MYNSCIVKAAVSTATRQQNSPPSLLAALQCCVVRQQNISAGVTVALSLSPVSLPAFPPEHYVLAHRRPFSPLASGCDRKHSRPIVYMYACIVITYIKSMDQPGKVANPARGQLNRENKYFLSPFAPENLVSRDGFGCPVPREPVHLYTQAEPGYFLRDSS